MKNTTELQFVKKIFDNPDLYNKTKVEKAQLSDPFARLMFSEIGRAINQYGEFEPRYLKRLISDREQIDRFKKLRYGVDISNIVNITEYLNSSLSNARMGTLESMIVDDFNRKRLSELGEKLMEDLENSKRTTPELLKKYSSKIDKLMYDTDDLICSKSAHDFVNEELELIESGEKEQFYKTGFEFLDQTTGITRPSIHCLVAGAKQGKSMFLYKSALNMLKEGNTVLFATIEINEMQTRRKMLSLYSGVPFKEIISQDFTGNNKERYIGKLKEFEHKFGNKFFIYQNKTGVSCKELELEINNYRKAGIDIDVICVDYLSIMTNAERSSSIVERLTKVVTEVRVLKEKMNVIIFTAQQFHPSAKTKSIDRLTMDDVYYTKSIGMEFDSVSFLAKDESDEPAIRVEAHRQGIMEDMFYIENRDFSVCQFGEDVLYKF